MPVGHELTPLHTYSAVVTSLSSRLSSACIQLVLRTLCLVSCLAEGLEAVQLHKDVDLEHLVSNQPIRILLYRSRTVAIYRLPKGGRLHLDLFIIDR